MEQYLHANFRYTSMITEACKRLKFSSIAFYAACSLYHKFADEIEAKPCLCQLSSPHDKSVFAVTSVYLASKLAEESAKIRDIVNVCNRILHPDDDPLDIGGTYWNLRDSVLNCELYLLRIFQFDAVLDYPQNYLLNYLNSLKPWVLPAHWEKSNVAQMAWNLLQDSFHINIKAKSQILALGVLKMAVDSTQLEISSEGVDTVWWQALCGDAKEVQLQKIAHDIMQVIRFERK